MKWAVPALVLALGAAIAVADGGGTEVQPDKPEAKAPAGNPNKAEPGLAEQGWKSYDATYVAVDDWKIKTFSGGLATVTTRGGAQVLALPVKDHDGVAVKAEEFAIEVDAAGDGKMTRLKSDGATCAVKLVYADGTIAPYNVRFEKGRGGSWNWQRSGYWQATINKIPVGVIDNNNNGKYDENGEDAVSVGLTGFAAPLSDVVNIGGTLYRVKVAETGKQIWVKEYDGETGKLDGRGGHKLMPGGALGSAVFQKGQTWIDVVPGKDKAVVVPVGKYEFFGGEAHATSGGQAAMMRKGNMAAFQVKKDETTKLAWGMDLKIDFDFAVNGKMIEVAVTSVHVYGTLGEEYYSFVPPAFTPVVQVWNAKTGAPAQKGSMALCWGGSPKDYAGSVGDDPGPFKVQLSETRYKKLFGDIFSDVKEKR